MLLRRITNLSPHQPTLRRLLTAPSRQTRGAYTFESLFSSFTVQFSHLLRHRLPLLRPSGGSEQKNTRRACQGLYAENIKTSAVAHLSRRRPPLLRPLTAVSKKTRARPSAVPVPPLRCFCRLPCSRCRGPPRRTASETRHIEIFKLVFRFADPEVEQVARQQLPSAGRFCALSETHNIRRADGRPATSPPERQINSWVRSAKDARDSRTHLIVTSCNHR